MLILLLIFGFAGDLVAQGLPDARYYVTYNGYYAGGFRQTERTATVLLRGANRLATGSRFLDSVSYGMLQGEAYYRTGQYRLAVERYEAAIDLYLSLQNWPERTQFVNQQLESQENTRNAQVPWAVSKRNPRYGSFTQPMLVRLGNTVLQNEIIRRRGGVIDEPRWTGTDIAEIMRGLSMAIYRRNQILGPITLVDSFTGRMATNLTGAGGATIQGAWTGIAKGLAQSSRGNHTRAAQLLQSSLQIGGLDHPLTAVALLELGNIALRESKLPQAQQLYLEASIAAAAFEQYDMVEESLRNAATIHMAGRSAQPYQPLVAAIQWARRENRNVLQAALLTTAAQVAAETGDARAADRLLNNARSEMRGNQISQSGIQTHWLYVNAMVQYQNRDARRANKSYADFLAAARRTSFWLHQIAVADAAVVDGAITDRQSENLYDLLLREPVEFDWSFRPDETMAFLTTPHHQPMERWFAVALSRKAEEKAIGIAELLRRQRFFSALPMGGRLLSLRWMLEAPDEALTASARKQKTAFLNRHPEYKQLSESAAAVQSQLSQLPISPNPKSPEGLQQTRLLEQLATLAGGQEEYLRAVALVREPCELAFPRWLSIPEIQQQLKPGQVMISILRAGPLYYVMKLTNANYSIESQIQVRRLNERIFSLAKALNIGSEGATVDPEKLQKDDWKTIAGQISEMIFARTQAQAIDSIDELIFIPDGATWYLPMELLQVGTAQSSTNLSDSTLVRYAPMASLGVPDQRTTRRFGRSAIVASRNFIKDDPARIADGLAAVQTAVPAIETLVSPIPGPASLLGTTIDQLMVWNIANKKAQGFNDFAPLQLDAGRPGSGLAAWIELPWRGPEKMVLSGVSTAIEGGNRSAATGADLFFQTTAMMASGTRTVLISRWRVGGQSTIDLTREFLLELGNLPAAKAWRRSVGLFKESEIDQSAEPRLRPKVLAEPLTGKHPYFWSSYMLLDLGANPVPADATTAAGAVQAAGSDKKAATGNAGNEKKAQGSDQRDAGSEKKTDGSDSKAGSDSKTGSDSKGSGVR